jgi:cysteine-S-conjugate beta-lyase
MHADTSGSVLTFLYVGVMSYNFDQIIDRTTSHSSKWSKFPPEVLPFWVADMDFAAPDFIFEALRARLEHPILGYTVKPDSLTEAFQGWLEHHYNWSIPEEWVVWVPGVVPMLNLATRTLASDASLLIPTPVYHPFLSLADNAGISDIRVPMKVDDPSGLWQMDFEAMAQALTPTTRMLMICNPQNPTGRCYSLEELRQLAEFIEQHDLLLVSDEIHCNIILDPSCQHHPVAARFPEIAHRTINLYAATKVYNIPGISCAAAVIPDVELRKAFIKAKAGLLPGIGPLGFVASEVAFNDRSDWVPELLSYLRNNLRAIKAVAGERLAPLQATYLAWLNVSDLGLENTESYFAKAGLGISPGAQFGESGYIRFNFGAPEQTLQEGLQRLNHALQTA